MNLNYCNLPIQVITNDSNWVDILTLLFTIISIIVIIYVVFLAKQTEIQYDKFKKLCLDLVDSELNNIYLYIKEQHNIGSRELYIINEYFSDLNILFISIRKIYPKIDIDALQNCSFEYTDQIFERKDADSAKLYFHQTRISILNDLYNYAYFKELNFLQRGVLKVFSNVKYF